MGLGSFVGNLTGGLLGQSDTEKAAKSAQGYSKQAKKDTLAEYDKAWGESYDWLKPYLDEGQTGLDLYREQMGMAPDQPVFDNFTFDVSKIEQNPAYQFVRDQGLQAIDRITAKNRQLGSGNRMTAIADYASGLASQEYGNEFNRQLQSNQVNNQYKQQGFQNASSLWDTNTQNANWLATLGANSANNLANLRTGYAQNRANVYGNFAAERTAADLLPAQEKGNFLNNLINTGGNILSASLLGGK